MAQTPEDKSRHYLETAFTGYSILAESTRESFLDVMTPHIIQMMWMRKDPRFADMGWLEFKDNNEKWEADLRQSKKYIIRGTGLTTSSLSRMDSRLALIYEAVAKNKPIEKVVADYLQDIQIREKRRNASLSGYDKQGSDRSLKAISNLRL